MQNGAPRTYVFSSKVGVKGIPRSRNIGGERRGSVCCVFVPVRHMGWEDVFSPNEVTIRNVKIIHKHKLNDHALSLVNSDAEQ